MRDPAKPWDGAVVRSWLDSRIAAARADQVSAERHGREQQDECDKAAAEEMVCAAFKDHEAIELQASFVARLKEYLERDDHVCRGVYDEARFDRHVRTYVRTLIRMAQANAGFDNLLRYR